MNIIYSTQNESLNLFYKTSLLLNKKIYIKKNIFLVSDSLHFNKWFKENNNLNLNENIFIKEWEIYNNLKQPDINILRDFEKKIAKPGLMDALISDRRIFMGFKCTFTQDYKRRFNDEKLMAILQGYLMKIDEIFELYNPKISMSFVCVTLFDYLIYLFAKTYNSKFINIRPAKIFNFINLSEDLIDPPLEIKNLFSSSSKIEIEDTKFAESFLNENNSKSGLYEGIVKPSKKPAQKSEINKKNIFKKAINYSILLKNYYFSNSFSDNHCPDPLLIAFYINVLNPLRAKLTNKIFSKKFVNISDLKNKEYAFFPMHTEPEVSLLVYSKPIINQIEIIRCIALSLPIGMKLVVKEHPWMIGKRKISAYKKLLNIPNVLISSPEISTNEWIISSKLVTVISSSVGQEAVFLGKPVLTFGNCMINILPNNLVKQSSSLIKLSEEIKDLIENYKYDKKLIHKYIAIIKSKTYPINLYSSLLKRKLAYKYEDTNFKNDLKIFVNAILDKLNIK